jgi:hypothetical protein
MNKAGYQTFQQTWAKTVNWARSQGIPNSAIVPVYDMDSSRFVQGTYTMSEGERVRAILASANPNNVTPLPSDNPEPGIGGFFHNMMHDAQNIFTGLEPTHLVDSIYQSVKNTVEHPGWLLDPEKNTLAQFIPGVSLIGEYEEGGLSNVLGHPLVTALNVLGLASAGVGAVAHLGLADTLAESGIAGVSAIGRGAKEGLGPTGIVRKAIGGIATGKEGLYMGPDGTPAYGALTVSQRVKNWTNTKGIGSDLAEIGAQVHGEEAHGASVFKQLVTDFAAANAKLGEVSVPMRDAYTAKLFNAPQGTTITAVKAAYNLVTMSGKGFGELAANDAVPVAVKELLPHFERAAEWLEEAGLASGKLVKVRMPDGSSEVYTASEAAPINVLIRKLDKSEANVDKLSKTVSAQSALIQHNDTVVEPAFDVLSQIAGQVQVGTRYSLLEPGMRADVAETLMGATRKDQMPERMNVSDANLASILGVPKVTTTQARMVNEIFGTGGLIDQIAAAYQREDFGAFRDISLKLRNKLKTVMGATVRKPKVGPAAPEVASPVMAQVRTIADNLYTYGKERKKAEDKLNNAVTPKLEAAVRNHQKLQARYEKAVWNHPSAVWRPIYVHLVNSKIAEDEAGALAVERALSDTTFTKAMADGTLNEVRSDPVRVIALIRTYMDASFKSPFGAQLDQKVIDQMKSEAKDTIMSMRDRGEVPKYVPNFSSRNTLGGYDPHEGSMDIHINLTQYMTPDAVRERLMDQSNTIYDIFAGMTRAIRQQVQSDATQHVIDDYLIPKFGYKSSDLMPLVLKENPALGIGEDIASTQAHLAAYLENTLGLERFDPTRFGIAGTSKLIAGDEIWMPKTILKGLEDVTKLEREGASAFLAGPTKVFRTAVLGYSPRFLAHILFGGSFLMALREPASFMRVGEALRMLKDDDFRSAIHTRSTQIGADDPVSYAVREFHREGGKTMGRLWAQEMMDKLGLDPSKISSWLQVIPQAMFKVTNTITDMQRAMVVLQGVHRAEKGGMTADRALEEGIRAANKVMGDLSHMTPLERNVITTIIPFYGWTKHILEYVATYPVDHPYRAVFLANMAMLDSDEVSKGLYTRIQNLFFLGAPDAEGNVSAIDVRFLNPLRDVANYATLGGLISMLNPAISALPSMVDPELVFGGNVLYPQISYNDLYGVKTAAPAGSWLTGAEQFVPELTALDAALGASSQYRGLAKANPNSFAKVIFGALNIPFAQVQHLNLKQIAATQEIDRYQQAEQASEQAFQTGDFAALSGYGPVPNPLQLDYNISPAQLQAVYNASLAELPGIPPSEALPSLPTPPGL